jgi:G3E family GTPase
MDQGNSLTKTPFVLITGFLGSGKTTLLKRFLNHYADQKRIAVIQNEFAAANVDGIDLKNTGKTFDILEINKGSVFCVCLLSGFVQSLSDLVDHCQPDCVILEATGLADPIAIGQLLNARELATKLYLSHVWSIVDATSFLKMEQYVQRMVHQVRIADTILLNKIDGVSPDHLSKLKEKLQSINPYANLLQTSFCDISFSNVSHTFLSTSRNVRNTALAEKSMAGGPPGVFSAVLRTTTLISRVNLEKFLRHFEKSSYRIKGTVNLADHSVAYVQSCFGKTTIKIITKEPGPTELIALGPQVDQHVFSKEYERAARQ